MQYSLKVKEKFTSEEKENNSQWDFYHNRNTNPEALRKAQHIFQHGAGIYLSTSQHQGCTRTLTVLRACSSHNHPKSIQIITEGSYFSSQVV